MTLDDLRTKFKEITGLHGSSDSAIDFYITSGQGYIENLLDVSQDQQPITVAYAVDAYKAEVTTNKNLRKVLVRASDDGTYQDFPELDYITYKNYVEMFPLITDEASNVSRYWTIGPDSSDDGWYLYIGPPTDDAITLELHGTKVQDVLADDADTNIFSEKYPMLLVLGAKYIHAMGIDNSELMLSTKTALMDMISNIDMSAAKYEDPNYTEMQG